MGIHFEQVTYRYRSFGQASVAGLDAASFMIGDGRFTAVLGSSGSGKSTMLQLMNGLLKPSAGKLRVLDAVIEADRPFKDGHALRKRVGLVFQYPESQLFEETVERDLMFGPLNFGASRQHAQATARAALQSVGLGSELLARHPLQLSAGQRRKAAIASVLACDPELLLLDEPAASLDQRSRAELMEMLHRLCRVGGKTIVVVTHRLDEVLPFADGAIVMQDGKAMFQGSPAELLGNEPFMRSAGLAVPPAVRFVRAYCERFGLEGWDGSYDPAEIARRIADRMKRGEAAPERRERPCGNA